MLVVICPHCDGNTFGHWFWDDVECDVCGQHYRMEEAVRISIAGALDEGSYDTPREAKVVSISDGDASR
jgi:tRNA(Ile2) C34 agmatinyltransferase TiaS